MTCGLGSTILSSRRRYQLACRNSWRCSWPKPANRLDSSDRPHQKKRVTTRFQGEEFRQHRIWNKPSKPPTCSPSRDSGANFAFILGKSAASSHLIGTALIQHKLACRFGKFSISADHGTDLHFTLGTNKRADVEQLTRATIHVASNVVHIWVWL